VAHCRGHIGPSVAHRRGSERGFSLSPGLAATFEAAFGFVFAACQRGLVTPDHLLAAMSQRPRLRWRSDLVKVLPEAERTGEAGTRPNEQADPVAAGRRP
jgi:hypothetical protein